MMKRKIFVFQFSYLPGNKAGGSLRTLANMVDHIGDEFDIWVLCSDRDLGDDQPYQSVKINEWQEVGKARVIYLAPQKLSCQFIKKLILEVKPDIIYLNSFFHRVFSGKPFLLRRFGMIPKIPVVVAPRGEFSSGAIKIKSLKKHFYVFLVKALGFVDNVTWHASNEQEEADIRGLFGQQIRTMIAPDLPSKYFNLDNNDRPKNKKSGAIKILFLSRIGKKKNLVGALEMLRDLRGEVQFNIYGPLEDKGYWLECQKIIRTLAGNINVNYCGEVDYQNVIRIMRDHDLLFVPTFGENFGYIYLEALIAGCPILLSDQTPWRNLEEKGIGWDIPLAQKSRFKAVLQQCINMSPAEHELWSKRANKYGVSYAQNREAVEKSKNMFYSVLESKDIGK